MSEEALFVEEDMERTTIADTPQPKRRGRPPGSTKSRVGPPAGTPPPKGTGPTPGPPPTPAQVEAARKARIKKREAEIRELMRKTVNPLLLQGAAMVVPAQILFQVEETPDHQSLQVVTDKDNLPVPTEWGRAFYVNELEIGIVAMTGARLEAMPLGGALARLSEQVLPYALIGGLVLASGMYARRVIGTVGQLRAATQSRVVLAEEPGAGENPTV